MYTPHFPTESGFPFAFQQRHPRQPVQTGGQVAPDIPRARHARRTRQFARDLPVRARVHFLTMYDFEALAELELPVVEWRYFLAGRRMGGVSAESDRGGGGVPRETRVE